MPKKFAIFGILTVLLLASAGSAPCGSGTIESPFVALFTNVRASAAPTPVNISNSQTNSSEPLIGVDANGKAYAVWYEHLNPRAFYFSTNKSGAWSTPMMIEKLNYDTDESGYPVWAVSPSGSAHLTFFDAKMMTPQGLTYDVFDRARENDAWGQTSNVSSNAVQNQSIYPGMAINPVDNYTYVVWSDQNGTEDFREMKYRYRKAEGTWVPTPYPPVGSRDAILPIGYGDMPKIAVDGTGTAHMVWGFIHGRRIWYSKNRTPQTKATWTKPIQIKEDAGNEWSTPTVTCDNAGNAYVLWMNGPADWPWDPYNPNNPINSAEIFVSKVNSDGTLGWEKNVSQSAAHSYYGSIAVNPVKGDIVVAWTEKGNIFANALIGGKWTGPGNLTNNAVGAESKWPSVAVDTSGRGHLVYVQVSAGSSEIMYLSYETATSTPAKTDFNGDGHEDILWRHFSTGQNVVWFLGGVVAAASQPLSILSSAAEINQEELNLSKKNSSKSALGDARDAEPLLYRYRGKTLKDPREINGDPSTENSTNMIWTDPRIADRISSEKPLPSFLSSPLDLHRYPNATNSLVAWATRIIGSAELPAVSDLDWQIVGTGDFNGDGKVDVLWRHMESGQNIVWLMNDTNIIGSAELPAVAAVNWQIVGTGDFSGDGKLDVLWRNMESGQNVVWLMNDTNIIGSAELPAVAAVNWQIVGTGDFSGDGKLDVLWRHAATGQNVIWLMDGTNIMGSSELPVVADVNWQIVGTGDFNEDRKVDVLWRHAATGQNVVWYMIGTNIVGSAELPAVADLKWKIVNR